MEYVYYTLVGLLALAGVGLVLVSLYKAVIFLGDTIDDWWDDRRRINHREEIGLPPIQWSKDGSTGRIVTEKHKHDYKLIRARHHIYEFVCRKDGCSETVEVFRSYFWDGEKTIRQQYEDAVRSMWWNRKTEEFDV